MKRYIPLILIFLLYFGDISSAEYTMEYKSGNTTIPDYRKISCFGTVGKITKPQAQFSITNQTTSQTVYSYQGKDCNTAIPMYFPLVGKRLLYIS